MMIPMGNLMYSLNAVRLSKYISSEKAVMTGYYLEGISFLVWAMYDNTVVLAIALGILGFALAMTGINIATVMQVNIPKEIYGKVSGINSSLLGVSVPLGYILGSVLITVVDIKLVLIASGMIAVASTYVTVSKSNI